MLLAEALASRKSALKKISEIETRISASAVSYEGEAPEDVVVDLLRELDGLAGTFSDLSVQINRTNNDVHLKFDGVEMSMMEAVSLREALLLRQRAFKRISEGIDTAQGRGRYGYGARRTKDDLKQEVHLTSASMRKASDALAQRLERLNIVMQSLNWTTEVIE